jgi:hypothetical protein
LDEEFGVISGHQRSVRELTHDRFGVVEERGGGTSPLRRKLRWMMRMQKTF